MVSLMATSFLLATAPASFDFFVGGASTGDISLLASVFAKEIVPIYPSSKVSLIARKHVNYNEQ